MTPMNHPYDYKKASALTVVSLIKAYKRIILKNQTPITNHNSHRLRAINLTIESFNITLLVINIGCAYGTEVEYTKNADQ